MSIYDWNDEDIRALMRACQRRGCHSLNEIKRLRDALSAIASCESIVAGDVVDIARKALSA